jgi:outer membrane protein assembly factor BamB
MNGHDDLSDPGSENSTPAEPKGIRWWPVVVILCLAVAAEVWVWRTNELNHQQRNLYTALVGIVALALFLTWVLFFSRLPRRVRFGLEGGLAVLLLGGLALFRIRGVTGDLLPVFEWRWHFSPRAALVETARPLEQLPPEPMAFVASTNDYPQFLGPHRNATVDGPTLARDWKAQPPRLLWRHAVGPGWSGFAVASGYAITQEQQGENEAVTCYSLLPGKVVWSHADPVHFESRLAGEGPRATPTIISNRVYAVGATGILNCLDLTTGRLIWSKDLVLDNHTRVVQWGMSGSPLILGDLVIVSPGGSNGRSVVAYRKDDGAFLWGGGDWETGYSSPLATSLCGVPQVLIFNAGGVVAHASETGKVLWLHPWPGEHPHVAMPVVLPADRVLVSSGYGTGSEVLQIHTNQNGKFAVSSVWRSRRLKAKFTNLVYFKGHIYGLDDGILACLNAETGEQKWKEGRYGHGQVILDQDLLLVMSENGELVLIEPVPEEPRERSRFPVLSGKTWNPPALAGPYLLVRNDKEAACYEMPVLK